MFEPRDPVIYDELWDVIAAAAVVKGQPAVIQDVFGFYFTAGILNDEIAFIYRMRQVLADKDTGSGEEIYRGDRVYYVVATGLVTANPVGVAGTDYYFCGWCKRNAAANETQVLINFDGTRYDENI